MGIIIEVAFIITVVLIILINLGLLKLSKRLKEVPNETNLSGMEIARIISSKFCTDEPHIIKKSGKFLDHYNISRNVIKLSPDVFDGTNMFASMIAINVALETGNEKITKSNQFITFVVLTSYALIILGALLNNYNIINFGLVMFILAFILELFVNNVYGKSKEEREKIYKMLEEEKVIKPFNDEIKENLILTTLIVVARLPYSFINYFR